MVRLKSLSLNIEYQPLEQGRRSALAPRFLPWPQLRKDTLDVVEQVLVHDRLVLPGEVFPLMGDQAHIEPVPEDRVESTPREMEASHKSAVLQNLPFGPRFGTGQISSEQLNRAELQIAVEDVENLLSLVRDDDQLSLFNFVTEWGMGVMKR